MSTAVNAGNVLLGRGKVYLDRFDSAGAPTGERFLGNVTEFSINTTDETREKYSSATAAAPLMKRVVVRRTPEISLTMDEFKMENLALILMGEESSYTQASTPVTAEDLGQAWQGRYLKTSHRQIGTVVLEPFGGGTPYIIATDYTIDADEGRIYIVPGGGIANDTQVEVDFTPVAIAGLDMVAAAKSSIVEGLLRYIGDPASGPQWVVEVWKMSINPDGEMGLIGDDFGEFKIKGAILDDTENHATEPFYRMIQIAAGT